MIDALRRLPLFLVALLAAATLAACGDDDADTLDPQQWRERAATICSDGVGEATALPLPTNRRELGEDAAALAEIVRNVHDGILSLGPPDGDEDEARVYLDELTADAELLDEIAAAARGGEKVGELRGQLDESAGQAALELGLDECAAFANAVARTP